ncbi:MAG: hypothetical protein GXC73_03595, partial [Chitinophagaceae bacterium]|nr:hypothetical protein [Chitinophagaceae bacterium]
MKPATVIHKTVSIISGTLLKNRKVILALLCVLFAVLFFKAEQKELADIVPHLTTANPLWMMVAGCITFVYVFFQSGIYKKSFAAFRLQLSWAHAALLFLTRNFISVFLPAGAVSSLAYTPQQVRKLGYKPAQLHQAGGLFAFTGLVTVFIVGLPVMLLAAAKTGRLNNAWL